MDYVLIVMVIVTVIIIVLTALYFKPKKDPKREKDPNVNKYMSITKVGPQVTQPIDKDKDYTDLYTHITEYASKVRKPIDKDKYYTDDEAIKLAREMKGVTLLRTNEGKVYITSRTNKHAEIVFIQNTPNPDKITGLWITNSPCSDCAQCLMTHFKTLKSYRSKPNIFIGKIYQQQTKHDDEGLQDLMKEGFNIEVWETFQQDRQMVQEIRSYLLNVHLSDKRMSPYKT